MNKVDTLFDLPQEMHGNIKCVELCKTEIEYLWLRCMWTVGLHCNIVLGEKYRTCVFACCYRLLVQLRDMEMAFDDFFDKHHLKLQQYLQLLRYEHSFQEVGWFSVHKNNVMEKRLYLICIVSHRWRVLWRSWVFRRGSSLLQEKHWQRPSRSSKSWIF